jgi:hypothetical protein
MSFLKIVKLPGLERLSVISGQGTIKHMEIGFCCCRKYNHSGYLIDNIAQFNTVLNMETVNLWIFSNKMCNV